MTTTNFIVDSISNITYPVISEAANNMSQYSVYTEYGLRPSIMTFMSELGGSATDYLAYGAGKAAELTTDLGMTAYAPSVAAAGIVIAGAVASYYMMPSKDKAIIEVPCKEEAVVEAPSIDEEAITPSDNSPLLITYPGYGYKEATVWEKISSFFAKLWENIHSGFNDGVQFVSSKLQTVSNKIDETKIVDTIRNNLFGLFTKRNVSSEVVIAGDASVGSEALETGITEASSDAGSDSQQDEALSSIEVASNTMQK